MSSVEDSELPAEIAADWADFWRDIVTEGGVLQLDQVKRELYDYHQLMRAASRVYYEVTDGRISKPNTTADAVIGQFQEVYGRVADDALDAIDDLEAKASAIEAGLEEARQRVAELVMQGEALLDHVKEAVPV